jgi:quercetin dioxygenase-like cupin family protein
VIRLRDQKQAMTWKLSIVLLAAALVAGCGGGTAIAAAKPSVPPGPVTKYRNMLAGQTAGAPIDLIQSILYFGPGAASVVHVHKSSNLATVLQGQVTVKMSSGEKTASAGDALVEPLNQTVQAVNTGSGEAMVLVAFPVPHGGKATAAVAGQPAPTILNKTLYSFTFDSPSVSGGYSLVQQVLTFAPGSQTPKHRHGGPGVITVLQGQVTLNRDGIEKTYTRRREFYRDAGPEAAGLQPRQY